MAQAYMLSIDSKTLRDKITCGICSKHYTTPKTLPCLHSYCLPCLKEISSKKDNSVRLTCPECKIELTDIPSLEELRDSFQVNRHLEYHKFKQKAQGQLTVNCEKCIGKKVRASGFCSTCSKFICDLCLQIHNSWAELTEHNTMKLSELKDSYQKYIPVVSAKEVCPSHNHECTIYCETCEQLVCYECILKPHNEHQYYHFDESAKKHRKSMTEQLDSINHLPVQLSTAISVIDNITQNFTVQAKAVEDQLTESFAQLEKIVQQKKEHTGNRLSERVQGKLRMLNNQKADLEQMMKKLSTCTSFVSGATENKHITEYFLLEKDMLRQISKLNEEFSKLDLSPVEEPEIHFSYSSKIEEDLELVGQVSDGSILHLPATDSHLFKVGDVITFFVSLSSSFYKTRDNPMDQLQAEIQSLRDNSVCPATVAVSSNGFAKLQCSFSERGRYAVAVLIGGKHISGSPYKFYVRPNGSQLQQPIKSINKLQSPKAIALNSKRHIVVCEESKHAVSVFGRKARKLISIGEYGKDKGQFSHPTGVAVDESNCVYIADSKNDRVQKFDMEGQLLGEYTGDKAKNTHLYLPSSIKIGPDGKVYIVDRGNCRIMIISQDLEHLSSFGGSVGYGLGSLQDPWDLAFDKSGFIYITDRRQNCIQIFTPAGAFRGKIGSQGQQKGKLSNPAGIAIDQLGKIYVCESGNHRVSIFHTSSEFLDCFSIGLSMVNPCGIAVDDDGFIYVASAENIHVF